MTGISTVFSPEFPDLRTLIPRFGRREIDIGFRHIRSGLHYHMPCIRKKGSYLPSIYELFTKGDEISATREGFVLVTICPAPNQYFELRDWISDQVRTNVLMKALYSWDYGDFTETITCEGVRFGFKKYSDAVYAQIKFGSPNSFGETSSI